MGCDISTSKFWAVEIIVLWSKLDRCKKELLLLDTIDIHIKLVAALQKILAAVQTVIKNITSLWPNLLFISTCRYFHNILQKKK